MIISYHVFIFNEDLFLFVCVLFLCVCLCVCTHVWMFRKSWKRVSDPLKLELQVMESHPKWVLGIESGPIEEQQIIIITGPSLQSFMPFS